LKDKFIITLSDIHGSKQYTVSQFIKVIVVWLVVGVVLIFGIGAVVINSLSSKVDGLKSEKLELKKEIDNKEETLKAMDEQLDEVKNLIGIKDEKIYKLEKKKEEEKKSEKEQQERIKSGSRELTDLEYRYLTRLIPNGKPLKFSRISTGFGFRIHPVTKRKQLHSALDLVADIGTKIFAPADGVVVYAGKKRFYGNFLLIRHGLGFSTAYGHLHRIGVKNGDYVKKGQLVALSGNTGRSTGAHLHYEIRYLSKWVDPLYFMRWSRDYYKTTMDKSRAVSWDGLIQSVRDKINHKKEVK